VVLDAVGTGAEPAQWTGFVDHLNGFTVAARAAEAAVVRGIKAEGKAAQANG